MRNGLYSHGRENVTKMDGWMNGLYLNIDNLLGF